MNLSFKPLLLSLSFGTLFLAGLHTSQATIHVIEARNFFYAPTSLTAELGDTIRFVWIEGTHPTESSTGAWPLFTLSSSFTSYDFIPVSAGNYPYICTIHLGLGMLGSFNVVSSTAPCGPSSPPTGLNSVPGSTSAVVSWNALPNALLYQVRGRPLGSSVWQKRTTSSTAVNVPGLTPGTTYQWTVRALCNGTEVITPFASSTGFTTLSLKNPEVSAQPGLMAFVQPGQLIYQWEAPEPGLYIYRLSDIMGRVIQEELVQCDEQVNRGLWSLQTLNSGLYFFSAAQKGGNIMESTHVFVP